jgi:ABC-type Fe3+/spermidine/putrescine transport system ATPase subunit
MPVNGSRATLAIRPERVIIDVGSSPAGLFHAVVDNLVYAGTTIHLHMRTVTGTRLIAYRQNNSALPPGLNSGVEVQVSWDPASTRLILD